MSDEADGSITHLITQLRQGDPQAVQPLWERYFKSLVRLARRKLDRQPRLSAAEDEEDLAQSAFYNICRAIENGRFPHIQDRQDLWRVLVYITACKVADRVNRETALKRGAGRVVLESELVAGESSLLPGCLDQLMGSEPNAAFAAELAEECQRRLEQLADPTLRQVAALKLSCYTNEEIRQELGCSLRSVTLKLELIRKRWRLSP